MSASESWIVQSLALHSTSEYQATTDFSNRSFTFYDLTHLIYLFVASREEVRSEETSAPKKRVRTALSLPRLVTPSKHFPNSKTMNGSVPESTQKRPNFLFILADDLVSSNMLSDIHAADS